MFLFFSKNTWLGILCPHAVAQNDFKRRSSRQGQQRHHRRQGQRQFLNSLRCQGPPPTPIQAFDATALLAKALAIRQAPMATTTLSTT
jgi:hypothetical protein